MKKEINFWNYIKIGKYMNQNDTMYISIKLSHQNLEKVLEDEIEKLENEVLKLEDREERWDIVNDHVCFTIKETEYIPIGSIIKFFDNIPRHLQRRYKFLKGEWLSKKKYSKLYMIIGGSYGENENYFRIPDDGDFIIKNDAGFLSYNVIKVR